LGNAVDQRPHFRGTGSWGLLGGLLITVGVFGEFWGAYKASRVETKLRENNHKIEESLNLSTETAASAASRAEASADVVATKADVLTTRLESASKQLDQLEQDILAQGPRWRLLIKAAPELIKQLAIFAGQRADLFVCGQLGSQDGETLSTWGRIADILVPLYTDLCCFWQYIFRGW
jgi:hypothetical protein